MEHEIQIATGYSEMGPRYLMFSDTQLARVLRLSKCLRGKT